MPATAPTNASTNAPSRASTPARNPTKILFVLSKAKSVIGDVPRHHELPEKHTDYFDLSQSHTMVPVAHMTPSKAPESQPKSVDNAMKFMAMAKRGETDKRGPITLLRHADGSHTVTDGNATYGAAKRLGWTHLPAKVVDEAQLQKAISNINQSIRIRKSPHLAVGMPPHIGPTSSVPPAPPSISSTATAPSVPHHAAAAAAPVTAAQHTLATGAHATPAITHAEMNLPDSKHARQPSKDRNELFSQAAEHKDHLDHLVDRGKGLSHTLGFHVVEGRDVTPEDYAEGHRRGGMVMLAPLKSEKRTDEKVNGKYKGDYSKIRDLSRASVAVSHPDDIPYVMHHLRQHGLNLGSKPDDRFAEPTEAGYSDLQTEHVAPNGHRGELQIHSLDHHEAKEQGFHGFAGGVAGHKVYEEIREMPEDAADLSPTQAARKAHLEGESKKLYGEAQRRAEGRTANFAHLPVEPITSVRKSALRFAHRVAGTTLVGVHPPMAGSNYSDRAKNMDTFNQAGQPGWFDFDGVPAHRENAGDRPKMFDGEGWVPVDPGKFAHQATRIQKHKFDEMVALRAQQHREFLESKGGK